MSNRDSALASDKTDKSQGEDASTESVIRHSQSSSLQEQTLPNRHARQNGAHDSSQCIGVQGSSSQHQFGYPLERQQSHSSHQYQGSASQASPLLRQEQSHYAQQLGYDSQSQNLPPHTPPRGDLPIGVPQQQQSCYQGQAFVPCVSSGQAQSPNAQQPGVSQQTSLPLNAEVQTPAKILEVQLAIAQLENWWSAIGIDDFTPYTATQRPKEKMANNIYIARGQMPERVCYILPSDADGPSLRLTQDWTDDDCSPRNMVHLFRSGYNTATIIAGTDPSTWSGFKNYSRALHMRALRWCYGNGVIEGSFTNRDLSLHYVLPLLKLSTAQLFFGVIGDLVVEDFARGIYTMTPPEDRWQHSPANPTIRYNLPWPKEIHKVIRSALEKQGRTLPTLDQFLQKNVDQWGDPRSIPGVGASKINHGPAVPASATSVPAPERRKITEFFERVPAMSTPTNAQDFTKNYSMDTSVVEPFMDASHTHEHLPAIDPELDRRLIEQIYRAQPSPYGELGFEYMPARNGPYPGFEMDDDREVIDLGKPEPNPDFNDEGGNPDYP